MLRICVAGLLIFIPLNYILVSVLKNDTAYYNLEIEGLVYTIAFAFIVFPLAIFYMMALALMYDRKWIQKLLKPVLAVGKTAFSNYVLQSLIGIIVFYGIGFGLAEQFGPLAWTVCALIIFTFQMIVSNIWLNYFRFGPLEWIWRSLTYNKIQPLRAAKK